MFLFVLTQCVMKNT